MRDGGLLTSTLAAIVSLGMMRWWDICLNSGTVAGSHPGEYTSVTASSHERISFEGERDRREREGGESACRGGSRLAPCPSWHAPGVAGRFDGDFACAFGGGGT